MSRKTPECGFTLTELLVVLVIVALVSGVLLSGFERVLDIRIRLAAFLDGVEAPVLVADWFRSSVSGLLADGPTGKDRFAGGPRRLTGLSIAPINGSAGVPTRIAWEVAYEPLAGRSYLRYRNENDGRSENDGRNENDGRSDNAAEMTIASWPGDYGGMRYCGTDRICHDSWPVTKESAELPALIRLDAIKGAEPWPILAAPQADRNPLGTQERRE